MQPYKTNKNIEITEEEAKEAMAYYSQPEGRFVPILEITASTGFFFYTNNGILVLLIINKRNLCLKKQ